jgi:hypothetical protein
MNRLKVCYIRRLSDYEKRDIYKKTGQNYKWVTEGEASWEYNDIKITVPQGFLTDGSSGCGPDYSDSWLIHDWLYSTHKIGETVCTRKDADDIMIDVLKWQRFRWYPFVVKYLFKLNPFWLFSKAWKKSGQRGPQFI